MTCNLKMEGLGGIIEAPGRENFIEFFEKILFE